MTFSLTTRWNAGRHTDGEALIDEILEMGFGQVELGYDLRMDLVPGVVKKVKDGAVRVVSVHNFCPVPVGAPSPHPELFTFASPDRRIRESAVHHTAKTARFAADVGAKVVIAHAGNVEMTRYTSQLFALCESGKQFTPLFDKTRLKLQITREKKAKKQIEFLKESLDKLLPMIADTGVQLALENLPSWESIPTEFEMETLLQQYESQRLRYWHDIGHSQVRENLGLINQERWLERLGPWLVGLHIHDVLPPASDHLMPPAGKVDFARLKRFATTDVIRVIEPSPQVPREEIVGAVAYLRQAWEST